MTYLELSVYPRTTYHHPSLMISFQPCRYRSVPRHLDSDAATFWGKGRGQESLTDQAERVVFELQAGNIGDIVALPVPVVDKGRWTSQHLGVIIDKNENDLYIIATRHGILSNK